MDLQRMTVVETKEDELYDPERIVLETPEEVEEFERKALEGEIDPGLYLLEVEDIDEDMAYPEDRKVPGFTAPHSREDIVSFAYVNDSNSLEDAEKPLREFLEEDGNYDEDSFLGHDSYGITTRHYQGRVLSRACQLRNETS